MTIEELIARWRNHHSYDESDSEEGFGYATGYDDGLRRAADDLADWFGLRDSDPVTARTIQRIFDRKLTDQKTAYDRSRRDRKKGNSQ